MKTEEENKLRKIESMEEIKKIELGGLITFHNFCMAHDLKYSIAAGTMLGAVRHRGFIPWDDDIDVFMVRKEYDKFLSLMRHGNKLDNADWVLEEGMVYPFVKLVHKNTIAYQPNIRKEYATGVWIDVFPLDNCGSTVQECRKLQNYMKKMQKGIMYGIMHYSSNTLISRIKNLYLFVFQKIFKGGFHKISKKYFAI